MTESATQMRSDMTALALRGVAAMLFGLVAVFWPGLTLVTLVYIVSIFLLVNGLIGTVVSLTEIGRRDYWWLSLILSILELGIGLYLVRHPQVAFGTFVLLAGLTLIVQGVVNIVRVFIDKTTTTSRVLLGLGGLVSIFVGVILFSSPVSTSLAFVWVFGLYALVTGPIMIALAIDARSSLDKLAKN